MKRFLLIITAMMLILLLAACGANRPSTEASGSTNSQSNVGNGPSAYTVEQVWLERDGMRIYGELYLPKGSGKRPLVILSHGFGGNHSYTEGYARIFAENGITAYAFDFIGGGIGSKSDGKITEMSVLTEAADLNAVIDGLLVRDDIDPSELYLLGGSQGGFVSTYVAGTRPNDVKGLIALYPAYVLQDDAWERTPDPENIPETMNLMGKTIGRIYNEDAMSFDIYEVMKEYPGDVLIIHGTRDNIAPISYSERAAAVFPSAELIRFDGAGHGFYGSDETRAAELAVDFVKKHLGAQGVEATDAVSSATLNIETLPKVSANGDSKILVAYFSTNDTIRAVALTAADVLDANIFEIVPVEPYSENDLNYH